MGWKHLHELPNFSERPMRGGEQVVPESVSSHGGNVRRGKHAFQVSA